MIQRKQTLWLILAAVAAFLTFYFPFYTGQKPEGVGTGLDGELEAGSNLFILILSGLAAILAIGAIFLFKDRKMQLKVAIAGLIVTIAVLVLYFNEVRSFATGHFALTSIFAFAAPVGFILAIRGIVSDEKLVKSLDKLR